MASHPKPEYSCYRQQTFRRKWTEEHIHIPATDDDDDEPSRAASTSAVYRPVHAQPTAIRYARRLYRAFEAARESACTTESTNLRPNPFRPKTYQELTLWLELYVLSIERGNKKLQDKCVEAVSDYYEETGCSAGAFRIEQLYRRLGPLEGDSQVGSSAPSETIGWPMKNVLLRSAAKRLLTAAPQMDGVALGLKKAASNAVEPAPMSGRASEQGNGEASDSSRAPPAPNFALSRSFNLMLIENADILSDFVETLIQVFKESK